MSDIILATEKSHYDDVPLTLTRDHVDSVETAITGLSRLLAEKVKAQIILAADPELTSVPNRSLKAELRKRFAGSEEKLAVVA